ncbi:MAG: hypothetical protein GWP17_02155 [Aquificales bacterium]|nr:hypothetical protein [Aquificales bacterium]
MPEQQTVPDLFSSYIRIFKNSVDSHRGWYYLQVNYQQSPWGKYAIPKAAPSHPVMIPVRHSLNLYEEDPSCGIDLETVRAFYASGAFTTWEVNARNIIAELHGVIAEQKEWALRDAIGVAYVPYNRVAFNSLPVEQRRGDTFESYENRGDVLSILLAGGGHQNSQQFAITASTPKAPYYYTAVLNPSEWSLSREVYEFSLIVAYGVHYKYFRDTSFGATDYKHRPGDCGENGPAFFGNQQLVYWNRKTWRLPTTELETLGGWPTQPNYEGCPQ